MDLQLSVANQPSPTATLGNTMTWGDYWRDVCAPKLKARKEELGRAVPEREIAAAVEAATGKNSERSLVNLWLLGEREPYISQFFALCEKLGMDPMQVLIPATRSAAVRQRTRGRTIDERAQLHRKKLQRSDKQ